MATKFFLSGLKSINGENGIFDPDGDGIPGPSPDSYLSLTDTPAAFNDGLAVFSTGTGTTGSLVHSSQIIKTTSSLTLSNTSSEARVLLTGTAGTPDASIRISGIDRLKLNNTVTKLENQAEDSFINIGKSGATDDMILQVVGVERIKMDASETILAGANGVTAMTIDSSQTTTQYSGTPNPKCILNANGAFLGSTENNFNVLHTPGSQVLRMSLDSVYRYRITENFQVWSDSNDVIELGLGTEGVGFNDYRPMWVDATAYLIGDRVEYTDGKNYTALQAHTSDAGVNDPVTNPAGAFWNDDGVAASYLMPKSRPGLNTVLQANNTEGILEWAPLDEDALEWPLTAPSGSTSAAPSYSFIEDSNSGMFRDAGGNVTISHASVDRMSISSVRIRSIVPHRFIDGLVSAPAITFQSAQTTGFYYEPTPQQLSIAVEGNNIVSFGYDETLGDGFGKLVSYPTDTNIGHQFRTVDIEPLINASSTLVYPGGNDAQRLALAGRNIILSYTGAYSGLITVEFLAALVSGQEVTFAADPNNTCSGIQIVDVGIAGTFVDLYEPDSTFTITDRQHITLKNNGSKWVEVSTSRQSGPNSSLKSMLAATDPTYPAWVTSTNYIPNDRASDAGVNYVSVTSHLSSGGNQPPSADWIVFPSVQASVTDFQDVAAYSGANYALAVNDSNDGLVNVDSLLIKSGEAILNKGVCFTPITSTAFVETGPTVNETTQTINVTDGSRFICTYSHPSNLIRNNLTAFFSGTFSSGQYVQVQFNKLNKENFIISTGGSSGIENDDQPIIIRDGETLVFTRGASSWSLLETRDISQRIVFRAGLASTGNYYGTWAECVTVINKYLGAVEVFFDDLISPCVIDQDVNGFNRLVLTGDGEGTTVTITETTNVSNIQSASRMTLAMQNTTATPGLSWTGTDTTGLFYDCSLKILSGSTKAMITTAASDNLTLVFYAGKGLVNQGSSGAPVITLGGTSILTVKGSECDLWDNDTCVQGGAGQTVKVAYSSTNRVFTSLPSFGGTFTPTFGSQATAVGYNDAVATPALVPSPGIATHPTTQEVIDGIKGLLPTTRGELLTCNDNVNPVLLAPVASSALTTASNTALVWQPATAGQVLTGNVSGGPTFQTREFDIVKSADEAKANDATPALDADLFFNVLAGETWVVKATIFASEAAANPNIQLGLGGTATVAAGNIRYNVSDFSGNSGTASTFNSTVTGINTTSTVMAAVLNGSVTFSGSGTAGIYWSQSSSNANSVTVYKMSFMKATKVVPLTLTALEEPEDVFEMI